jgi:predicted dinucleotide-utilizing enzyme
MSLQRLGIIGCGGIAELVLATLKRELPSPLAQLSILASPRSANKAQQMLDQLGAALAASRTVQTGVGGLVADKLDAVAECASHIAVRDYFTVRLNGRASPDNAKTSLLTGYSVAREIINRAGTLVI